MSKGGLMFWSVLVCMLPTAAETFAACDDSTFEYADFIYGWGVIGPYGVSGPGPRSTPPPSEISYSAEDACSRLFGPAFYKGICTVDGIVFCKSSVTGCGYRYGYPMSGRIPYCPPGFDFIGSQRQQQGEPWPCERVIAPQVRFSVRLVNETTQNQRPGFLADVMPNPGPSVTSPFGIALSQAPLRAKVTCNGAPVSGIQIRITPDVEDYSGGHQHLDGRRFNDNKGYIRFPKGSTSDAEGYVDFVFHAPQPAGDHKLTAECVHRDCGTNSGKIWVGVKNLVALNDTQFYRLVGSNASHPRNHYLTYDSALNAATLAINYRIQFPTDPVLHYNDASLERGGLFDLSNNWDYRPWGHKSHRHGTSLDVRANPAENPGTAIPERIIKSGEFKDLACRRGGVAELESEGTSNQHYHIEFTGCTPKANTRSIEAVPSPPPADGTPSAPVPGPVPVDPCAGPNPDLTLCF